MTVSFSKSEIEAHRIRDSMTPTRRLALSRMGGISIPEWDEFAGRPKPVLRVVEPAE